MEKVRKYKTQKRQITQDDLEERTIETRDEPEEGEGERKRGRGEEGGGGGERRKPSRWERVGSLGSPLAPVIRRRLRLPTGWSSRNIIPIPAPGAVGTIRPPGLPLHTFTGLPAACSLFTLLHLYHYCLPTVNTIFCTSIGLRSQPVPKQAILKSGLIGMASLRQSQLAYSWLSQCISCTNPDQAG